MSRTATATPPPTYFPQRNATPTMRHCSAPNVTGVHFVSRHPHQPHLPRRKSRNVSSAASAFVGALSPKKGSVDLGTVTPAEDALGMSFEDISPMEAGALTTEGAVRRQSPVAQDKRSDRDEDGDQVMGRVTPTPSMSTSYSESFTSTTLPTPSSSRAPSLLQPEIVLDAETAARSGVPIIAPSPMAATAKPSWVPYFGKMAKAVVNTGFMPFADKKKKDIQHPSSAPTSPRSASLPASPSHKDEAVFVPCGPTPRPTFEELSQLSEEEALERRKEWAIEQQRRVTECARLCSQWPQSGYNQSKWGPNGSRNYYEPQSYANPQYVATLMTRQADLERQMHQQCALHYTCRNYRASSEGSSMMDSEASLDSYESAHTSPTSPAASLSLSADLSAAMASPLISADKAKSASQVSLLPASPASASPSKGAQSLTELDTFSKVSLDSSVELDPEAQPLLTRSFVRSKMAVRPARAQSCGAKRPLTTEAYEEEKRRRVDEAAVVSEAVDSGVIMPPSLKPPVIGSKQMSASVPDLSAAKASTSGAVFGHMVKTSDTHPIIISPFFPTELIPTIARSVIFPPQDIEAASGFMLGSKIDVPSLLLSFAPPARPNGNVVVPSLAPMAGSGSEVNGEVKLGNLLLSSCPGKRLRMEGPVKGRGPVCRDLATDLRRIKSEGVGCLVCCLDDPELALLGVPWETYHQVAIEIGLDVIRVPMPDGFTPVSLNLFDEQVSMIVRDYSLKGINVLVHCRGGVGRAGLTASAWAIKMGLVPPHPSLVVVEEAAHRQAQAQAHAHARASGKTQSSTIKVEIPAELEHQIVMSIVERVIAMIRSRRGLKAIESFEQVQFLASYVRWIRATSREKSGM